MPKTKVEAEAIAPETVTENTVERVEAEAPQADAQPTESQPTEGARVRRAFAMKQFSPNPDWINKNVVAGGKGTRAVVGRVFGYATGYERKFNEHQGQTLESIAVKGVFQSEGYVTGEVGEATIVYFPMAYAEKIAAAFDSDANLRMVEVDCDIGLEATGKTIPYEWTVTAYREGQEMAVLRRLKGSRPRPTVLLTAPGEAAKALPGS